ncbi:hypothetical protein [Candidatus Trichorickettsia mobilis]|uniref:hypothetical protein n=1 Tax=Candidatus Trichorickettsia mobilis TaxID=1346319 RepID=UPI00292EEDD7|nr:hypothetical protein [Candidatus Trichorickettsia mobilis]
MPKIQSFQGYVKNVLLPILQNHQTNPIDQITCKSLLQFAGYLDDSNGFLKNAHHNMSLINELNESAAIFFSSDNSDANVDYIGDSGIDY